MLTEDRVKALLKVSNENLLNEIRSLISSRKTPDERKLTSKEAASVLGISLSTLYKNVKYIPHRSFGKKLVFVLSELQDFDFASLAEKKSKSLVL